MQPCGHAPAWEHGYVRWGGWQRQGHRGPGSRVNVRAREGAKGSRGPRHSKHAHKRLACVHAYMHVAIHVCLHAYIQRCMYVCMYASVCRHTYIYIYSAVFRCSLFFVLFLCAFVFFGLHALLHSVGSCLLWLFLHLFPHPFAFVLFFPAVCLVSFYISWLMR